MGGWRFHLIGDCSNRADAGTILNMVMGGEAPFQLLLFSFLVKYRTAVSSARQ